LIVSRVCFVLSSKNREEMMDTALSNTPSAAEEPRVRKWRALNARQRRVVGVLIEKAKTTPDVYPMTLNSLTAGCNQKSNRSPQMNLSSDDVEVVLEELREMGAVVEVQTSGRVPKFRHQMYDWLGVDKVELAVMAELFLRGEQSVGELRSRAARMEPIAGIDQLRPVLQSLMAKNLVISLSPEGRGQIVSHGLYKDRELGELHARAASMVHQVESGDTREERRPQGPSSQPDERLDALRAEIHDLRAELAELRSEVEHLKSLVQ
jgi:uncharacterized protein